MTDREIIARLRSLGSRARVAGMARYGIAGKGVLGVPVPALRALAKECGRDHALALRLWRARVHEARILAAMIADPERLTEAQMESWAGGFRSWDVCDQVCQNLFVQSAMAWDKCREWSRRDEEFVKRAAFSLMACLAAHDKAAGDSAFIGLLPLITLQAGDERNYVKKSVNWALRQIGKRNAVLRAETVVVAEALGRSSSPAAHWIAADALRELQSPKVRARLRRKKAPVTHTPKTAANDNDA